MRNLFLLLILANLGFAAWHRWYSPAAAPAADIRREFGEIMLASEFASENPDLGLSSPRAGESVPAQEFRSDPNIVAEVDPVEEEPVAAPLCMSVGPFRELSQVAAAAASLREDGLEPRQRAGRGDVWSGYWVYLANIETIGDAREMIETLHANGMTDAYVIPDSDSGTLISLGVFSEIVRASRVREQVRALGFEATIADRVREASVYWIDVDVAASGLLDFERLQPPGRIIRLELRPCNEVEL